MVSTSNVTSNTQIFRAGPRTIIRLGHQAQELSIPNDGSIFSLDQAIGILSDDRTVSQGDGRTLLNTKFPELTSSEPPIGKLGFLLNVDSNDRGENISVPNLLQKTLRSFNLIDSYQLSRGISVEPFEEINKEKRLEQGLDAQRKFILDNIGNSPERYFIFFRSRLRRICKEEVFFELLNKEIYRVLQLAQTDNTDEKITSTINQLIRAKDGTQNIREHCELNDEQESSKRLLFKDLLEEDLNGTGEELLRNTTVYGHTISDGVLIRELRDKQFSTSTTKLLEQSSQGTESREKVERAVKLLRDLAFYQDLVIRCKTLSGGDYNLLTQAVDTLTSSFDETGDIRITISRSDTPVERLIKQAQIETLKIYNSAFNQEAEALNNLLLEQPITTIPSTTVSPTPVSVTNVNQPTILFTQSDQPNNSDPVIDPIALQAASNSPHGIRRRKVLAWGIGAGVLGSVLTILGAAGYNQFTAWSLRQQEIAEASTRKKIEEEQLVTKKKAELTAKIDAALNLDLDAIHKQAVDELEEVKKANPIEEGIYGEKLGQSLINRYTKVLLFYLSVDPEDSTLKKGALNSLDKINKKQSVVFDDKETDIYRDILTDYVKNKISRDELAKKLNRERLAEAYFLHQSFYALVNVRLFDAYKLQHPEGLPKDLLSKPTPNTLRKSLSDEEWCDQLEENKIQGFNFMLGQSTLIKNTNPGDIYLILDIHKKSDGNIVNYSNAKLSIWNQAKRRIELKKKEFVNQYRKNKESIELHKLKKLITQDTTLNTLSEIENKINKIAGSLESQKRDLLAYDRCIVRLNEVEILLEKKIKELEILLKSK